MQDLTKDLKTRAEEVTTYNEMVKFKRFVRQNTSRDLVNSPKSSAAAGNSNVNFKPNSNTSLIDLISEEIK